MSDNQQVIGFIGVGVMGNPIARHLIAKGHEVIVYDRSEAAVAAMVEAGAKAAASTARGGRPRAGRLHQPAQPRGVHRGDAGRRRRAAAARP